MRAFAIIMMLQGHFIDTLLAPEYRDPNNMAFQTWKYFRGITAPIFFTISGIIFSYLLILSKKKGETSVRIRKGFIRGFLLIGIGYALRAPVFEWLIGIFKTYFLIIDVLQCIGLSIIIILIIYYLSFKKTLLFSILMLSLSIIIFITEPLYRNIDVTGIPLIFANYLSTSNGSIFPILPWLGYMFIGSFIATLLYQYLSREKFKPILISGLISIGILLFYFSSSILMSLHKWSQLDVFKEVAYNNYLFTRLGNVLILLAIFYGLERYMKHEIILKIGQKTLSIYIIHFIIIYGSFTGLGLSQLIGKVLNPYQATIGALLFIGIVCCISLYGIKNNDFIYNRLRGIFKSK